MKEFEELFYRDPYCREFDAKVLSCTKAETGYAVMLDDTAFYPEGGGQPADHGTLNGIAVIDTRRTPEGILHITAEELKEGTAVHGIIDWQRRFDHMQQHTGEHIISGLIHQHFGYDNVGFHMGDDVTLIDFDGMLTWQQIQRIELEANEIIWKNEAIEIAFPTSEALKDIPYRSKKELSGDIRIVTIPEADICACCGTHVARTGEIGLIKALSSVKHHNGTRIELVCGKRAYLDDARKTDDNQKIMNSLSCKRYETANAVKRLLDDSNARERTLNAMAERMLKQKADTYPTGGHLVIDQETGINVIALRSFCNQLISDGKAVTAAVLFNDGTETDTWNYLVVSNSRNLRDDAKVLNEKLNGRGGGRPDTIQGSFHASYDEIEAELKQLLA